MFAFRYFKRPTLAASSVRRTRGPIVVRCRHGKRRRQCEILTKPVQALHFPITTARPSDGRETLRDSRRVRLFFAPSTARVLPDDAFVETKPFQDACQWGRSAPRNQRNSTFLCSGESPPTQNLPHKRSGGFCQILSNPKRGNPSFSRRLPATTTPAADGPLARRAAAASAHWPAVVEAPPLDWCVALGVSPFTRNDDSKKSRDARRTPGDAAPVTRRSSPVPR